MDYPKEILDFIEFDEENYICYLHRTNSEEVANLILNNGFEYAEAILKTTDVLVSDIVVLRYLHNIRKEYGKFCIIICISNTIYDKYLQELKKISREQEISVEEILSEKKARFDEERDQWIFTLSLQFIKGYFNEETFKLVKNSNFDPFYDSNKFSENIERLDLLR